MKAVQRYEKQRATRFGLTFKCVTYSEAGTATVGRFLARSFF